MIISFTPYSNVLKLDIMQADRFKGQVSFPCTPGKEYGYEELKAFSKTTKAILKQ